MMERAIEQHFVAETKKRGGLALKFVSPGMDGVPDRIVLMPGGKMAFVELKAPGKAPRPLQQRRPSCPTSPPSSGGGLSDAAPARCWWRPRWPP